MGDRGPIGPHEVAYPMLARVTLRLSNFLDDSDAVTSWFTRRFTVEASDLRGSRPEMRSSLARYINGAQRRSQGHTIREGLRRRNCANT